jgi:hypothetical protein
MFEVTKLKWRRYWLKRSFDKKRAALRQQRASRDVVEELGYDEYVSMREMEEAIDFRVSIKLLDKARAVDADIPPNEEKEMWHRNHEESLIWLTAKGRAAVRKSIDEERTRRREMQAWWWKSVILPALSTIIGILGAVTGLVAVLRKGK